MISIIKHRKIWFTLSSVAIIVSIVAFAVIGLKLGIDFTGGSLLEVSFPDQRPTNQQVIDALSALEIGTISAQPVDENGMVLRFENIDETKHQEILKKLNEKFIQPSAGSDATSTNIVEKRFDSIGPTIGQELKKKTVWALILVNFAIITYIWWAFRKVSKPVASWKYGIIAAIALVHDIIITVGAFAILGKEYGFEANAPFIAALLTILGYSVNDTIVIFDRIRENLIRHIGEDFEKVIDNSINEVIIRSINISFTVLLTLFSILLFGGPTIRDFVMALIVGVAVGTYSSIFLASPLLVIWEKLSAKK
ncbi:MAG: protein translocase subunit SecF [Patescibacteria group bacterium]|nr:protein translocase subunit SecF [Patescibacteria group bacterium]